MGQGRYGAGRRHSMARIHSRKLATIIVCALLALLELSLGERRAVAQPQPPEEPVVRREGDLWTLSLPGGEPFHRTTRPIVNVRTIGLPKSEMSRFIILWEELDGQSLVPGRAISMIEDTDADGQLDTRTVPIAGETDYRLKIRFAEFDPVGVGGQQGPGIGEPSRPEGLSAGDVPGGCHVYIVQFWTQPLPEFREALVALGATRHNFLASHSYIVHIPDVEAVESIRALPFVRWVGPFHPAYRLASDLMAEYFDPKAPPPADELVRYNIEVFERGIRQKEVVAARIRELGGRVSQLDQYGFLVLARVRPNQIAEVLGMDEVAFVGRWGAPTPDMDKARAITGATYLATSPLAFKGQGVRGEIMDDRLLGSHPDEQVNTHPDLPTPIVLQLHGNVPSYIGDRHGTCTFGILFSKGTANALATGMLPSAERAIFASYEDFFDEEAPASRYAHIKELVDPTGEYRAVL
jgi:serine protease AprX